MSSDVEEKVNEENDGFTRVRAELTKLLSENNFKKLDKYFEIVKDLHNQSIYYLKKEFDKNQKVPSLNKFITLMKETKNLENEINYKLLPKRIADSVIAESLTQFKNLRYKNKFHILYTKNLHTQNKSRISKREFHLTKNNLEIKGNCVILYRNLKLPIPEKIIDKKIVEVSFKPYIQSFLHIY